MFVITPAYGRDYKSKAAILADLDANKDFVAQPQGQYINKSQLQSLGETKVQVRYGQLRKVTIVDVK